jgi:opacity protein-like surface antigen
VLQEDVFKVAFKDETRPLVSFGGGVAVLLAKHLALDVGYRFSYVFITKDYLQDTSSPHQHTGVPVNRFYFGGGFVF